MTKEEILQGNALIIEFMEIKPIWNGSEYIYTDSPFYYTTEKDLEKIMKNIIEYAKYHSDWNWLMNCIIKMNETKEWDEYNISDLSIALVSVDIEYAYSLVVKFINWYNTQEK